MNAIFFSPDRSLCVWQFDRSEELGVAETLYQWISYAQKAANILSQDPSSVAEAEPFCSAVAVLSSVCKNLGAVTLTLNVESFGCYDAQRTLQGVVQVSHPRSDILLVEQLVSRPQNFRSHLNQGVPNRVSGVGTLLMAAVEERARHLGKKSVVVISLERTKLFYLEKLQYQHRTDGSLEKMLAVASAVGVSVRSQFSAV